MKTTRGKASDLPGDEARGLQQFYAALAKPIRVRILGWLRGSEPKTQSEVGRALGLSNASARYHLHVLMQSGLISFHGTRPGPNGITEKLYRYNAEAWAKTFKNPIRAENGDFMLDYVVAWIEELHRDGVDIVKGDWQWPFTAGAFTAFASPEAANHLKTQINELLTDFCAKHREPTDGSGPIAATFAMLPARAQGTTDWATIRCFEFDGKKP